MEQETKDLFYNFIHSYYPELKAFSTSYLTLVTTILVFSITFAEKVVQTTKSNKYHFTLFTAWFMFLLSLIFGGYGLWRLFAAYNIASNWYNLYDNVTQSKEAQVYQFKTIYDIAYRYLNYSGIVFVIGIFFLVMSGLIKLFKIQKEETAADKGMAKSVAGHK